MTTEQKLREALRIAVNYIDMDALYIVAGVDHDTIKEALATTEPVMANGLTEAETDATASVMGLATTEPEPEPTGMPELPEPDWYMVHTPGADFDWSYTKDWSEALELSRQSDGLPDVSKITSYYAGNRVRAYGEQCWKAGYDLGKSRSE